MKIFATTAVVAASLAAGIAFAQGAISSTPGAGCTATANAMRNGNMGSSPSPNITCASGAQAGSVAANENREEAVASTGHLVTAPPMGAAAEPRHRMHKAHHALHRKARADRG